MEEEKPFPEFSVSEGQKQVVPAERPAGERDAPSTGEDSHDEDELELPGGRRLRIPKIPKRVAPMKKTEGSRLMMPIIVGLALATLVITIVYTRFNSINYGNFVFFLVIFTLCAHFDLKIKGGGEINLGLAPLLAAMIALPAVQVAWIFLFGSIVTLITLKIGEITRDDLLALMVNFTGVGVMSVVYQFFVRALPKSGVLHGNYSPWTLVSAAIGAAIYFAVQIIRSTYFMSQEGHIPAGGYFVSVLRKSWLPFLEVGFVGVLMGLIFLGIGMWSVLIALPMLVVLRYSYNRVAATDQYLLETIRILSTIPEETGIITQGHAERVARMSVDVAREMGLSPEDLQQVEYAAYLHDMGAITRSGGAEEEQQALIESEGVIAGGVDIIGKVGYLQVAAEILRGREGLRDRVEDVDKRRAVSVGAGILRAVDDFEKLVRGCEGREPLSESDALTEMNLERGVRYDSKVLRAIARVITRLPAEGYSSIAEGSTESSPVRGEQES